MKKPFLTLRLVNTDSHPGLGWTAGETLRLPCDLAAALGLHRPAILDGLLDVRRAKELITPEAAQKVRNHAAFIDPDRLPRTSSPLLRFLPRRARVLPAKLLGFLRRSRWDADASFPQWPLDLTADCIADLNAQAPAPIAGPTPVILTHDVDSKEGLLSLVRRVLPMEERLSARSTNFIVPLDYPLDHGLLRAVCDSGHEIGMHGYNHEGRTPFLARPEIGQRLDKGLDVLGRYSPVGYRAPSLFRTPALMAELALRFRYDSSIPNSGGVFPYPGNGCASARPFALGRLWELPITIPRDMALVFMGYSPAKILEYWLDSLARIRASGGVAVLLLHPEPYYSGNANMLNIYARFLETIAADPDFRFARACDFLSVPATDGAASA